MINPAKYVRKSIIDALAPLPVWANRVPKNQMPTPASYCLITSQGKSEYAICKRGNEWQVNLNLDFFHVGALGFDYSAILDDIIETAIPKMKELKSPNIKVKNVFLELERDLSFDTVTNSVNRKVLSYLIWIDYAG